MPDNPAPKDYSLKQLNSTDLSRHCHVTVHVQSGDELWIGDVQEGADPIVTLSIKNVSFYGHQSKIEAMIRSAADLFDDLNREPERAHRLLSSIKRVDPAGRRTTPHPLYRELT